MSVVAEREGGVPVTEECAWCAAACDDTLEVNGCPVCSDACRDALEESMREDEEGNE